MPNQYCYGAICFVRLDPNTPILFGFPEFLAGLALLVLAWTTTDVRYRFRVQTAPIPLREIMFIVVGAVGLLTLLTDLWRAEQWWVPQGPLSPALWQALLAGLFLFTFLTWAWYAFMRAAVFSKWNARRYAEALYQYILRGAPDELAVIARELLFSVHALVLNAPDASKESARSDEQVRKKSRHRIAAQYAHDMLLLIADRRFCRMIVQASPATAAALFAEIAEQQKYGVAVHMFGRNIMNEAVANKDSFIYHESEPFQSGLLGYHQPVSHALFGNHVMVDAIGTLLDPDLRTEWDSTQWKAYCHAVLTVFKDYVGRGSLTERSRTLLIAKSHLEHATFDLYTLNGAGDSAWRSDPYQRLRVIVEFVRETLELLNSKPLPSGLQRRNRRDTDSHRRVRRASSRETAYDDLAEVIAELVDHAASVQSPSDWCWTVQHNTVWGDIFRFGDRDGDAQRLVAFKVRRIIYDHISEMERFPNFQGAKFLGFCLNVFGLRTPIERSSLDRDSLPLHRAVLSWTKKNFAWLHTHVPRVAERCLVAGTTYDAANCRLIKTIPADGLRRHSREIVLAVDPLDPAREPPPGYE